MFLSRHLLTNEASLHPNSMFALQKRQQGQNMVSQRSMVPGKTVKIREKKGTSFNIVQKGQPHPRSLCARTFAERAQNTTLSAEESGHRDAWKRATEVDEIRGTHLEKRSIPLVLCYVTLGFSSMDVVFGLLWNGGVLRPNVATLKGVTFGISRAVTKRLDLAQARAFVFVCAGNQEKRSAQSHTHATLSRVWLKVTDCVICKPCVSQKIGQCSRNVTSLLVVVTCTTSASTISITSCTTSRTSRPSRCIHSIAPATCWTV